MERMLIHQLQSGRIKGHAADNDRGLESLKDRLQMRLHSIRLKGQAADEATVWKVERACF